MRRLNLDKALVSEVRLEKLAKIKSIKKFFGWNNADIAAKLGSTEKNIKSRLSPASKQNLPVWVDAFIVMFEACKNGPEK